MSTNQELIHSFYEAFSKSDSASMVACYHEDATFTDPVFINLNSAEVKSMWTMLIERGKGEIEITYDAIYADERQGKAHWEAIYKFSQSGNIVHNKINASFTFKDGKILTHTDDFDLKKWAGMALGLPGKLFGGMSWMKNKIRSQARANLVGFMSKSK